MRRRALDNRSKREGGERGNQQAARSDGDTGRHSPTPAGTRNHTAPPFGAGDRAAKSEGPHCLALGSQVASLPSDEWGADPTDNHAFVRRTAGVYHVG